MSDVATADFRTVAESGSVPNDLVVSYYLHDRKLRVALTRYEVREAVGAIQVRA